MFYPWKHINDMTAYKREHIYFMSGITGVPESMLPDIKWRNCYDDNILTCVVANLF